MLREATRPRFRRALPDLRLTLLLVGAILGVSVVAIVLAYALKPSSAPDGDIQASTIDFKITMPTSITAGKHTIGLTNAGTIGHELVLFKTDLSARNLPLKADGDVDEESGRLTNAGDSGDALKGGGTKSFKTTDLVPGHYVAVCNLPGHYRRGMKLDITVK